MENMEFGKQDIVKFLNIALETTIGDGCGPQKRAVGQLPRSFKGLTVEASVGAGRAAFIPWIAFLGFNQLVKNGIYPVLLFYHNKNLLIVSYGVSATNNPSKEWGISEKHLIGKYFEEKNIAQENKEKNYNTSYLHSAFNVFTENGKVDESKFELDSVFDSISEVCEIFKNQFENKASVEMIKEKTPIDNTFKNRQIDFNMESIIKFIKQTGLLFDDNLIQRYAYSLLTKPFVILSGLAGSGKTQLALAFAKALVEDEKKQMCIVSVGADWTNREPLLGYPNALKSNEYVKPDSGVLDLLIECNKPENSSKPYFLILDEMNLSYVERYFADFLSSMESHEPIPLWKVKNNEVPESVALPKNLFVIGTINVDETTYMFSPKVLDRASVIEFKVSEDDMENFLDKAPNVDVNIVIGKASNMAENFVRIASETKEIDKEANDVLKKFFKHLKTVNAEFGYRTATEIGRFISLSKKTLDTDNAIDAAIVQKLLPKLHGSRKKIVPVLKELWKLCGAKNEIEEQDSLKFSSDIKYPLTADKVLRMYNCAIDNGFTSFAEA